jgi:hypothetical protein
LATFVQLPCHPGVFGVGKRFAAGFTNGASNVDRAVQPLNRLRKMPVDGFCPFVDIVGLAMRSHSETLRLAAWPKSSRSARYLICSQALIRKSVPRITGPVLAMNSLEHTAENRGRVLLSMRAGAFSNSLSRPSHRVLSLLGGSRRRHARLKSAEAFEVFSAANCSAAAVPPRRFEHHVINNLRI